VKEYAITFRATMKTKIINVKTDTVDQAIIEACKMFISLHGDNWECIETKTEIVKEETSDD